jgi:uncharacterized damage-inducible protein DinB
MQNSKLGNIAGTFSTNTGLVSKALAGIRDDEWGTRPGGESNPPAWVAGHLVYSRGLLLRLLGLEWTAAWEKLVDRGVEQVPAEQYPTRDEIARAWDEVSARVAGALENVSAEALARPVANGLPSFDGKVAGAVALPGFHETYHVGQLGYLHKWLGHGSLVG